MSERDDYTFTPKLGRSKADRGGKARGMKAHLKASRRGRRSSRSGSQRSAGVSGARRVVIQAKFVRLGGKGIGLQKAHVSYLQRDGAGREGEPGEFYNNKETGIDGRDWLEDHREDRHHFRFIVSPEDGQKLEDLKPFVRELVGQMEIDLETELSWIAVDHHNTEHPHTHIVMSGKCDDGRDLVIPRDYLSHGMRERGSAILTRDLGLQTERELSAKLEAEIGQCKITRIDRVLLREMHSEKQIDLARVRHNGEHYKARLETLRGLGLAEHVSGARWTIDEQLGPKLTALERGDTIARRIESAVKEARLERIGADQDRSYTPSREVRGRLLKIGLANELQGSAYAIVDGLDGRVHHFDLGTSYTEGLKPGDMLEVKPRAHGSLNMDRTIANVAVANDGIYSARRHILFEPDIDKTILEMTERRLVALTKLGLAETLTSNETLIPDGFVKRVNDHAEKAARRSPQIIRKLERLGFESQVRAYGETWLDRQLAGMAKERLSEAGLGGEVRSAMAERMSVHRQRLLGVGKDAIRLTPEHLQQLQREGMGHAANDVAKQIGLKYRAMKPGEHIEGHFRQTYETPDAKFAIIERGRHFSLVPWREGLEVMRHKQLEISMSQNMQFTWRYGRTRGLSR